jgi:hypothetical protein
LSETVTMLWSFTPGAFGASIALLSFTLGLPLKKQ